jgi:hypothetical protein
MGKNTKKGSGLMKNNLIPLSIFSLAVSIVTGCWLISNSLKESNKPINSIKQAAQHQLLTQAEVADYLGISKDEVQKLTSIPEGDGIEKSELPYIKIENNYYYPKTGIDKWLLTVETTVVP